jgi:hypothetical protein
MARWGLGTRKAVARFSHGRSSEWHGVCQWHNKQIEQIGRRTALGSNRSLASCSTATR